MTRGSYVRVFDGDRLLSSYEVQLLLASIGQPRDDELPAETYATELLDPEAVNLFCARLRQTRPNFADLDNFGVLRRSRVIINHERSDYVDCRP